jgi:hypothetical protein
MDLDLNVALDHYRCVTRGGGRSEEAITSQIRYLDYHPMDHLGKLGVCCVC